MKKNYMAKRDSNTLPRAVKKFSDILDSSVPQVTPQSQFFI